MINVPTEKLSFPFWKRVRFWRREREIDLLVHAHCIISLLFFVFCFLSYLFLFPCFLTFFLLYFSLVFFPCFFDPLFWAQWRSSYSACRDQILLFFLLTTFVWCGCTYRPLLVHLHHPPQLQTKKKRFYLLACCGTLPCYSVGVSLSNPHGMHLTVPPSTLPLLGGMSFQQDVPPKRTWAGAAK